VGGQVLVRRVTRALLDASSIGLVFVVGPEDPLNQAIADLSDRVIIVKQAGRMLSNSWAAIHAAEAQQKAMGNEPDPERPILVISCDLPLISGQAIDDFVGRCAFEDQQQNEKYAMLVGITEEDSLEPYYPSGSGDGIIRPYVHFNSCRARLANIYVGRPRKLSHQELLQTGFSYRKAKDWKNVVSLTWSFFKQAGGWKASWLTIRFQATLMASRRKGWWYRRLRKRNSVERVEQVMGTLLGGRIRMVSTPYGGLSLDVDEEEDYRVLSQRFDSWSEIDPTPKVKDHRIPDQISLPEFSEPRQ
jgi:hypothetical protein